MKQSGGETHDEDDAADASTKPKKRSSFERPALLAVASALLLFFGVSLVQGAQPVENGVTTTGMIVDVRDETQNRGLDTERRRYTAVYRFMTADGVEVTVDGLTKQDLADVGDVGDTVDISYNSAVPTEAKELTGNSSRGKVVSVIGGLGILAGAGWALVTALGSRSPSDAVS